MMKYSVHIILFSAFLMLVSFNSFGQKSGAASTAARSAGCDLYIPNAFTPNGDDINERFVVSEGESCRVLEYSMRIFDRWGRLVFETTSSNPQNAWDGTSDGKEMAKGVYMYNVRAKLEPLSSSSETQMINRQGTVVLIR